MLLSHLSVVSPFGLGRFGGAVRESPHSRVGLEEVSPCGLGSAESRERRAERGEQRAKSVARAYRLLCAFFVREGCAWRSVFMLLSHLSVVSPCGLGRFGGAVRESPHSRVGLEEVSPCGLGRPLPAFQWLHRRTSEKRSKILSPLSSLSTLSFNGFGAELFTLIPFHLFTLSRFSPAPHAPARRNRDRCGRRRV